MVGGQTDFMSSGGNPQGNYTNWLAQLYNNLGNQGGSGFNARDLLSRLFNPMNNPNQPGGQSSLYNILSAGDASTQARTLYNMARDAAQVGMNPLAARGYANAFSRANDLAVNQAMQGNNNTPVYELMKSIAPGLVPG
jgi:hypothetical protein